MNDLQQMGMSSVPGSTLDLSIPGICEGYLMKRRKYPLNGWHKVSLEFCCFSLFDKDMSINNALRWSSFSYYAVKEKCSQNSCFPEVAFIVPFQRYFLLEKGILKYSKTQQDVSAAANISTGSSNETLVKNPCSLFTKPDAVLEAVVRPYWVFVML